MRHAPKQEDFRDGPVLTAGSDDPLRADPAAIFDCNQTEFTQAEPRTIPTIAVVEQAQTVLQARSVATRAWV